MTIEHFTPIKIVILLSLRPQQKRPKKKSVGKDMEISEYLCIAGGNVKWFSHSEK